MDEDERSEDMEDHDRMMREVDDDLRDQRVSDSEHVDNAVGEPEGPITVRGCARCGETHDVESKRLSRPIVIGAVTLTHWALCPTNGEPILMRKVSLEEPAELGQPSGAHP